MFARSVEGRICQIVRYKLFLTATQSYFVGGYLTNLFIIIATSSELDILNIEKYGIKHKSRNSYSRARQHLCITR